MDKNEIMENLGYRSEFKRPKKEDRTEELRRKHGVENYESAAALEQGYQAILQMIKRPGALEGLSKASKMYFAQKVEFIEKWKRGEISSLWDYFMTKDEMMRCFRDDISFGRWVFNKREHNWELLK